MSGTTIVLGSRGSKLALWQTEYVRGLLEAVAPEYDYEIKVIHTKGDKILDVALSKIGDKGLFTKELERELLSGGVDLCVHSMKDMPTLLPEGLAIKGVPPRANSHDALVSMVPGMTIDGLPAGARVATGSLRRVAQLKRLRPDVEAFEIRGNVNSRVQRVVDGEFDAAILAAAGLERLGMTEHLTCEIPFDQMLPAVAQGAIAVEVRESDPVMARLCELLSDEPARIAVEMERQVLRELEGGCQVPMGAHAQVLPGDDGAVYRLEAFVASLDGSVHLRTEAAGCEPRAVAQAVIAELRAQGAEGILEALR